MRKKVVNDYLLNFGTFNFRWFNFNSKPIIAFCQFEVLIYLLIKSSMLGLKINAPGFNESWDNTEALLNKPKGMFKTDKNGNKSF
ncbi:hypothetical protein GALMADRAFT_235299 [Galerina marginata CBS 339.88]|uniref:Uncharacterized protein n=1 Tax=Galerina marginata (strain CBS 339.88) TaxID=685588 RepID=A0A067TS84_GALM3|nr:hypothetical protein GALMADRAFT_235299 [Galerina marginata CBS 339.88]